jgi:hypothetical protein
LVQKQVCHPGKYASTGLKKGTELAGIFIRGLGFCDREKKFFSIQKKTGPRITTPVDSFQLSRTIAACFPG